MLDVSVLSSFTESAGLCLFEAMAAGPPNITTDCCEPSKIEEDGICGLVIPFGMASGLAAKIRVMLDNTDSRKCVSNTVHAIIHN